jgi:spore coat polysaccharide biosynthesis predicted glycosyltransferase SpsG
MKNLTKKVLIIIASVIVMGLMAAIPGFAETQEELKQIFVTRDEINLWIKLNDSENE